MLKKVPIGSDAVLSTIDLEGVLLGVGLGKCTPEPTEEEDVPAVPATLPAVLVPCFRRSYMADCVDVGCLDLGEEEGADEANSV